MSRTDNGPRDIPIALFILGLGILVAIAIIAQVIDSKNDDDEGDIPLPPPGYEYCTTADGRGLKFCERE